MLRTLKLTKDKVEYLLEKFPQTRDSDTVLFLGYLKQFHGADKIVNGDGWEGFCRLMLSKRMPTPATLKRVRAKIQEEGRWVGTKRARRQGMGESLRKEIKGL